MELFLKGTKKMSNHNFEKAIPKFIFRGIETSIEDEIIYLYGLKLFKEDRFNNYDLFWNLFEFIKELNLNKREAESYRHKITEIAEEFDGLSNTILKSPDNIMMLNSIRTAYIIYKLDYAKGAMYNNAVGMALRYLKGLMTYKTSVGSDMYRHCREDEISVLAVYSILGWVLDETSKVPKDRNVIKLITKYIGNSFEDMVSSETENRFKDMYLEYKTMCNDNYTDEQREEYWESKKEYIMSDFGNLDKDEFDITEFSSVSDCKDRFPISCIRPTSDSFRTLYSKYYKELGDIEDTKARKIIFNLIQRYLSDVDEMLCAETMLAIKMCLCYAVLNTDSKSAKAQFTKDLDKIREQNKMKTNKFKKELEQTKEQLAFNKDKTDRLMKELKKLDKDAVLELETKISELEELNAKLKKKEVKHAIETDRLNDKIAKLEEELEVTTREKEAVERELREVNSQKLDNSDDDTKFSFQSKDIPSNVLYNAIKDKRILLVGGNKIHARIIERGYDNIELLRSDNVNITMHAGQKYDLVVIYTKLVSHSVIERVESELKNSDIPIIRFNQAGINTLLFTIFMYIYGGYDTLVGKYSL